MGTDCCGHSPAPAGRDQGVRAILWLALAINGGMFAAELLAGLVAGSVSLQADALDFLGDAANYALSLSVIGMGLASRARSALLKAGAMVALGAWVIGSALWHAVHGTVPEAAVMGLVGLVALAANALVAVLLYRFRTAESNLRSAWICSRNDAIGNLAVLAAAAGVFGTGTAWPDIMVALVMSALSLSGASTIIRQALGELSQQAHEHHA